MKTSTSMPSAHLPFIYSSLGRRPVDILTQGSVRIGGGWHDESLVVVVIRIVGEGPVVLTWVGLENIVGI